MFILSKPFIPTTLCETETGDLLFGMRKRSCIIASVVDSEITDWKKISIINSTPVKGSWYGNRSVKRKDGSIWVGSSANAFYIFRPDGTHDIFVPPKTISSIASMCETKDGTLWFSDFQSLGCITRDGNVFYPKLPEESYRLKLLPSSNNNLWAVGIGSWILETGNEYSNYLQDLTCFGSSRDGSVWYISDLEKVVSQHPGDEWIEWSSADNLPDYPVTIYINKENSPITFGYNRKQQLQASIYKNGKWKRHTYPRCSGFFNNLFIDEDSAGALYAVCYEPAAKISWGLVKILPDLSSAAILTEERIPSAGIACLDDKLFICENTLKIFRQGTSRNALPLGRPVRCTVLFSASDDTIWGAIPNSGIFRYQNQEWRLFDARDGAVLNNITSISEIDDGKIMALASDKIVLFDAESQRWNPVNGLLSKKDKPKSNQPILIGTDPPRINLKEGVKILYRPPPEPILDFLQKPATVPYGAVTFFKWETTVPGPPGSYSRFHYSWKLDDSSWSEWSKEDTASFHNLSPGSHQFRLRMRDSFLNITEARPEHLFRIQGPWWRNPWFSVTAGGTLFLFTFMLIRMQRMRTRHKLELERMKMERIHEMDQFKLRMFTNISHEFKTPLTLITAPLEKRLSTSCDSDDVVMYRNAQRLLRLINEILDIRKLDAGRLKLNPTRSDLIAFIKDTAASFQPAAQKQGVNLNVESQCSLLTIEFDAEKLDKIIYNLLSNAFKYVSESGTVSVTVKKEEQSAVITVFNTGSAINQETLDHLFDRFYQADKSRPGTGIGLNLVQELTHLHNGTIHSENKADGVEFRVMLPLMQSGTAEESSPGIIAVPEPEPKQTEEKQPPFSSLPKLLIVEDTDDIREYLKKELADIAIITAAENGALGLKLAETQDYDLVLSDVMMPEMDGFELCRRIKNNQATSHIPVILLTAKGSEESRIEGLEIGADDYVPKPFNLRILRARIENILKNRRILHQKFSRKIDVSPSEMTVTPVDEQFITDAIETVEKNMKNAGLGTELLADYMGVSRATLYRKIKAVTGMSVNDFIKTIRLKRAARLLKLSGLQIKEIAAETGFSTPSSFSTAFKKHFGVSPGQYNC